MKYIIDPTKPFEGAVVTSMKDDVHSDYGGETLDELKAHYKTPDLVAVPPETVAELVEQHRQKLNKEPFEEITEEKYEDLFDCLPPARMLKDMFFVGECYQYDLYPFCFTIGGRYFEGKRILNSSIQVLREEIQEFYNNLIKSEANDN